MLGRCIVPATTYLLLVWETLSIIATGSVAVNVNVEFEDVRFLRATSMTPGQKIDLNIMVHHGSGQFEITENSAAVVTGLVRLGAEVNDDDDQSINNMQKSKLPMLDKKSFYKELRLRGYHYQNLFQGVEEASGDGLCGKIKWNDNWPAFMDCMLQLNILANDSRSLYLPTRIRRVQVNSMKHTKALTNLEDDSNILPAYYDSELKLIKCGGIEIYEMVANSVVRRKPPGRLSLEDYRFLPLIPSETLTLTDGARVITQLIIENTIETSKLKIVEVDSTLANPIISAFDDVISETPLIKAELHLITDRDVQFDGINKTNEEIMKINDKTLTIGLDCLMNGEILNAIDERCFLLSRQTDNATFTDIPNSFNLISAIPTENETLVLIQRQWNEEIKSKPNVIEILSTDNHFQWIDALKASIQSKPTILVAQNDATPGLLGLVNCLRREPHGERIRCVIIMDRLTTKFSLDNQFYVNQLDLGLAINVYRNSVWGTYRFLKLKQHSQEVTRSGHVYANVQRIGDLSSFDWFYGSLSNNDDDLVNIHYSSINFRDIMLASGRLSIEFCRLSRTSSDCVLGKDYG